MLPSAESFFGGTAYRWHHISVFHAFSQVSKWTRLCEIGIPSAVEEYLRNPNSQQPHPPPPAILTLEQRLSEPVKVHNDDKIRRQKLKQLRQNENNDSTEGNLDSDAGDGLELKAALAKLSVAAAAAAPTPTTRERYEIRKVKTNDLPLLEHVFAEGLYFTLTDVVLLPCIHQYMVSCRLIIKARLCQCIT